MQIQRAKINILTLALLIFVFSTKAQTLGDVEVETTTYVSPSLNYSTPFSFFYNGTLYCTDGKILTKIDDVGEAELLNLKAPLNFNSFLGAYLNKVNELVLIYEIYDLPKDQYFCYSIFNLESEETSTIGKKLETKGAKLRVAQYNSPFLTLSSDTSKFAITLINAWGELNVQIYDNSLNHLSNISGGKDLKIGLLIPNNRYSRINSKGDYVLTEITEIVYKKDKPVNKHPELRYFHCKAGAEKGNFFKGKYSNDEISVHQPVLMVDKNDNFIFISVSRNNASNIYIATNTINRNTGLTSTTILPLPKTINTLNEEKIATTKGEPDEIPFDLKTTDYSFHYNTTYIDDDGGIVFVASAFMYNNVINFFGAASTAPETSKYMIFCKLDPSGKSIMWSSGFLKGKQSQFNTDLYPLFFKDDNYIYTFIESYRFLEKKEIKRETVMVQINTEDGELHAMDLKLEENYEDFRLSKTTPVKVEDHVFRTNAKNKKNEWINVEFHLNE